MQYRIEVKKAKRGLFVVTLKITNCDAQSLPPARELDPLTERGIYAGRLVATYAWGKTIILPEGDSAYDMFPSKIDKAILYAGNLKETLSQQPLTHAEKFRLQLEETVAAEFEPPF